MNIADTCAMASEVPVELWPEAIFAVDRDGYTIFGRPASLRIGTALTNALVVTKLCPSRSAAHRAIKQGGVRVRGQRVTEDRLLMPSDLSYGRWIVFAVGPSEKRVARTDT